MVILKMEPMVIILPVNPMEFILRVEPTVFNQLIPMVIVTGMALAMLLPLRLNARSRRK
jgi:hypothetical protein